MAQSVQSESDDLVRRFTKFRLTLVLGSLSPVVFFEPFLKKIESDIFFHDFIKTYFQASIIEFLIFHNCNFLFQMSNTCVTILFCSDDDSIDNSKNNSGNFSKIERIQSMLKYARYYGPSNSQDSLWSQVGTPFMTNIATYIYLVPPIYQRNHQAIIKTEWLKFEGSWDTAEIVSRSHLELYWRVDPLELTNSLIHNLIKEKNDVYRPSNNHFLSDISFFRNIIVVFGFRWFRKLKNFI